MQKKVNWCPEKFQRGGKRERKGGKKMAKEGILGVGTKQKGNEKGAKMWQKGEKEGALGVSTEQKYRYKKGGERRQKGGRRG